jgi:hypothetical protein
MPSTPATHPGPPAAALHITRSPGRETPAGVFRVVQKDKDHPSNLYDDAWMPNMLRITWSGIALHGGPLPGYRLRKQLPEPVFGQVKQARGFRQFLLRGFEKVRAEWAIVCTVHNLLTLAQRRSLSCDYRSCPSVAEPVPSGFCPDGLRPHFVLRCLALPRRPSPLRRRPPP